MKNEHFVSVFGSEVVIYGVTMEIGKKDDARCHINVTINGYNVELKKRTQMRHFNNLNYKKKN